MFGSAMRNTQHTAKPTLTAAQAAFDAALAASEAAEATFKSSHDAYCVALRAMLAAKAKRAADQRAFRAADKAKKRTAWVAYEAHLRALHAAR